MSSVVAVAGGTGGIGRAVVEEIIADGKFSVVILSRKADPELEKTLGARIMVTDYSNADELAKQLQDNNEHALIQAAHKSSTTTRYIPSVWGLKYTSEHSWFPITASKLTFFEALDKTQLEWTVVANGFFLDYWGFPHVKTYLQPVTLVLDLAANRAAIPGSGNTPVVSTYTRDVAKFTAKLLTLDKWEPESYIIGDKVTWNEFVKTAEQVRGKPIEVSYDSIETLKSGKITELPSHQYAYPFFPKEALQGLFSTFGRWFEEGVFNFQPKKSLNDLFPEIKTTTVKEILEIQWNNGA
ncbi:Oxidoreductase BOA1 like protein [Verticillium longisporum]|nr:Oxidoreductase BOA1 like protein [Verticillium longisporum]